MAKVRELLKDKNFFLLWVSQIISNFGDRLNQMALIGLVYSRTPGSTLELAKLLSFTIMPVFIVGPVAGIFVDRWDRKYTMVICDLLRGLLVLSLPFIIANSTSMVPIYILVFIIFSLTRFFLPSKLSIIPDIVHRDSLLLANSMASTTMMIAAMVGFGAGGIIVGIVGPTGGFYIDAVTYFLSAVMMSLVTLRVIKAYKLSLAGNEIRQAIKNSLFRDLKEGLVYFKGHKDIRMVANTMFIIMAGAGSIYITIIVFIQEKLKSSTQHLGLLAMFLGGGLFLGSLLYGRLGNSFSRRKVINVALAITGFLIAIFALALKAWPSFFVASALSILIGIFASPIAVSANTLLHEVMEENMRGRVFSTLEVVMHTGFILFMLATSLIAEITSKGFILIIIGAVFSAIGFLRLTFLEIMERRPKRL